MRDRVFGQRFLTLDRERKVLDTQLILCRRNIVKVRVVPKDEFLQDRRYFLRNCGVYTIASFSY